MMFAITVSFFLTLRRIIYNTMKTKYRAMILTVCFCVGVLLSVGCEPDCTCDCEKNGFDTPPPFVPDPSLPLPDPDPEPGPAPEPAEARRQTIEYFLTQLDQDDIVLPPSFLYGQMLTSPEEIATERAAMWELWKEANTQRLEESGILQFLATGDTVIWNIPAGQRMKALLLAKGDKPADGYPLYINLHGGGRASFAEHAWDSSTNTLAWESEIKRAKQYDDAPSMYYVPRMADDRIGRWYLGPQRNAFRRVFQLAVLSGYADPDRFYILGTSEGGYGSHRLALFMPDYFAGAGPMAAAEPLGAAENLRNIAFGMEVGERDMGFRRAEFAQQWKDELDLLERSNPGDFVHRVDIQPGKGHGDTDFTVMTPWLKQFSSRRFEITWSGNTINVATDLLSGDFVRGDLGIYLDPAQVDLTQPVTVKINGRIAFEGMAKVSKGYLAESIALFGDPHRIYPSKVRVLIY